MQTADSMTRAEAILKNLPRINGAIPMFVDGEWRLAEDGATRELFNPSNGEKIATIAEAGAADAQAAIDILLDIGLPGMDGYDVARCIRQRPGSESIVLVALTGHGQEEDRRRSAEAGFDHHLTKPVDPAALFSLVSSVPRRADARAAFDSVLSPV